MSGVFLESPTRGAPPIARIALQGITKIYQNGEGVANIDLSVYPGELLTLLGPSGCGKTTILRVVGGFLVQNAGSVVLNGQRIEHLPPEKRPTAMVFQSYNLWPHMTVRENLAFGLRLRRTPREVMEREIQAMLALVGMSESLKKYPAQLSGGQQQRVAIARALLLRPEVLLLDEPFSALDAKIRAQMRVELKRIQREIHITVIFVTHDQEEAMAISDRVVVMNHGGIEQVGTPAEIYDEPSTRFVAEFVGKMNFLPAEDGKGVLAVRPEDLRITPAGAASALAGTVESLMVMGPFFEVLVRVDSATLKAVMSREEGARLNAGDHVFLSWTKSKSFPNPRDGESAIHDARSEIVRKTGKE